MGGSLISGGGTAASLTGAALPGFTVLADFDAGAPPEPVSLPLSAFLPLDTLSRTEGGASSRAALSTLDGRPVRGSAAFAFFSAVGPACSFGGRPRRFGGLSASGAFLSGAGAEASLVTDQETWDKAMRDFAAKNLTGLANNWLSQDEESARDPETAPITEEEFAQRILLTEVSVSPGGRFTAYYNDDDMFWGHAVEVSGSLKKGITYANLAG